ncbi:hypothetical protein JHK86_015867 [Glycine max]|nr:hypothetical protein JHK86_015867 [Glycine max]
MIESVHYTDNSSQISVYYILGYIGKAVYVTALQSLENGKLCKGGLTIQSMGSWEDSSWLAMKEQLKWVWKLSGGYNV